MKEKILMVELDGKTGTATRDGKIVKVWHSSYVYVDAETIARLLLKREVANITGTNASQTRQILRDLAPMSVKPL